MSEAINIEKDLTKKLLEDQRKVYEKQINDLNVSWSIKLNADLKDLQIKLKSEFEKEIKTNSQQLEKIRVDQIKELNESYLLKIKHINQEIQAKVNEINKLNEQIIDLKRANSDLNLLLEEIRLEFKACIERFTHLNKSEADFLFPFHSNPQKI